MAMSWPAALTIVSMGFLAFFASVVSLSFASSSLATELEAASCSRVETEAEMRSASWRASTRSMPAYVAVVVVGIGIVAVLVSASVTLDVVAPEMIVEAVESSTSVEVFVDPDVTVVDRGLVVCVVDGELDTEVDSCAEDVRLGDSDVDIDVGRSCAELRGEAEVLGDATDDVVCVRRELELPLLDRVEL